MSASSSQTQNNGRSPFNSTFGTGYSRQGVGSRVLLKHKLRANSRAKRHVLRLIKTHVSDGRITHPNEFGASGDYHSAEVHVLQDERTRDIGPGCSWERRSAQRKRGRVGIRHKTHVQACDCRWNILSARHRSTAVGDRMHSTHLCQQRLPRSLPLPCELPYESTLSLLFQCGGLSNERYTATLFVHSPWAARGKPLCGRSFSIRRQDPFMKGPHQSGRFLVSARSLRDITFVPGWLTTTITLSTSASALLVVPLSSPSRPPVFACFSAGLLCGGVALSPALRPTAPDPVSART